MASPLEQALPRVPAWVDGQTVSGLTTPRVPPERGQEINSHSIVFQKGAGIDDSAEHFLATTSLDTIGIVPPGTPNDTVEKAIERTIKDEFASRRSPTQRLIIAAPDIAERLRSAFPKLPILDSTQIDRLLKRERIAQQYGVEFADQVTFGMLYTGATVVDRLILAKDRGRIPRFVHAYTQKDKVLPSAIKAAALLAQHPEAIYVQKNYGDKHTIFDVSQQIPIMQILNQLDLHPSDNIVARRALLDHTPLTTGEYGHLITLIVAAEYAEALNVPLGKVLDILGTDGEGATLTRDSSAYQRLEAVLSATLTESGLRRVIDMHPEQYMQLNEKLRHTDSPQLGQFMPGFYTLLQDGAVDLDAVRELEIQLHRTHFPGLQKRERRTTLGMTGIEKSVLPSDIPPYIFGYTTYGRWHTSLPSAVGSVGYAAKHDGITKDSAFMIADGTPDISDAERAGHLRRYFERDGYVPDIPIYILTQEDQQRVIDEVERRTGLPKEDIIAVIGGTSCGDNRQKLVVAVGSYVMDRQEKRILGLKDDDLEVHHVYPQVRMYGNIPNSQVIVDANRDSEILFALQPNGSLKKDFLDIPGKTLTQLRVHHPDMPATRTWIDSMHRQLDEAQQTGVAVFAVNPDGPPISDATVWGISAIKHLKPDYRTIKVAKDFLLNEFPPTELSMASFPAGPSQLFAFRECNTNVDLAFSAWFLDHNTVKLPYVFLVSRDISLENPLQTVTTNTRADNELQPTLLPRVLAKTGQSYVYVTGSPLRVEHHREPSGYRPDMIEQACTSLVDNLYAQAANEMMEFADGFPYLPEDAINAYSIPEERARGVFRQLQELAQISAFKISELRQRSTYSQVEEVTLKDHLHRYENIIRSLRFKLGVTRFEDESGKGPVPINDWDNVAFWPWKEEVDGIGRKQLYYFGRALKNTPIITRTVHKIIQEGKYPVSIMMPNGAPSISIPESVTTMAQP